MWFSDQANHMIVRYDGSTVTKFLFDPEDPNSISGYYPETLARGKNGVVWIGYSQGGGLDHFDPKTDSFTNYLHDPEDSESLTNNNVSTILVDREGMVWAGTFEGLDRLDPSTGKFTHFLHDEKDTTSLSHNIVRSIYEDSKGTLWVGTGVPWSSNPEEGGLNRYDPTTKSFTRYLHDPEDANSLLGNAVRAIFEDSQGKLWVGTDKNGLHLIDRTTGTIKRVKFWPDDSDNLEFPPSDKMMDHITFINEDHEGFLLIGVYDRGIIRWDPDRKNAVRYGADGVPAGDYDENTSWAACVSDQGMIWLASQDYKLYKADPGIPVVSEVPISDELTYLVDKGVDQLWLGTFKNGLIVKNKTTGQTRKYRHSETDLKSISDNTISTMFVDAKNTLWIGTLRGLNKWNEAENNFVRYTEFWNGGAGPMTPLVTEIYEDAQSRLWIGTDQGLFQWNRETDSLVYQRFEGKEMGSFIVKVMESHSGEIKVVDRSDVYTLNLQNNQFEHQLKLPIPLVLGACIDKKDILWVASSVGLWNTNASWDTITKFQIPQTGEYIGEWSFSILADPADNLWIGTVPGIIKLGSERDEKILLGSRNGVETKGNTSENPLLSDVLPGREGQIYFVRSPNGYYYLDPEDFKTPESDIRLWARNLQVNNEPVYPGAGSPIETAPADFRKLHLTYSQNNFGLIFSAIDYTSDLKKKIYYKLDGYEDYWQESLSGQRVNYTKVPSGDYKLLYKSPVLNTNDWVEKSLDIHIANPWWKTGWAYSGYALLLITGVYFFDKYQKRRILLKQRNLAKEKELAHAKEIEKAYTELKQTQTQLIHSEKMASLGELTAGIAHEIQNPLNFVNNFSEVSNEMIDEVKEEMDEGDITEAKTILDELKNNLSKISHHGNRASGIVKGMLEHSRSSDGKKSPTDLNALADEYVRLAYHGLRAKDKSFNANTASEFEPDLPKVSVVPQEIGRVLLNLLTNAFYAVNDRNQKEQEGYEPTVWVITRKTKSGVEISVRDNGDGIPEAIREKIFQPFFTTKPTGEGTGLGLSMSYDIVTKGHGGTLDLQTEEGAGSEFIINLPV